MSSRGASRGRVVYRGTFITVRRRRVRLPDGRLTELDVIEHPPAATIVPVLDDGRVVLIRQFRPVLGEWLWELPAGKIGVREDPLTGARRELEEETGYRAGVMARLAGFYPAPGTMTEWMTVWVARGLTRTRAHRDADEVIRVRRFPVGEVRAMIESGKIKDAKSLVGLLAFFQFGEGEASRPLAAAPPPLPARRARRGASSAPRR